MVRSTIRLFGPLVPDKFKINPSGYVKLRVNRENSIKLKTNQTSYVVRELYWKGPLNFEYSSLFIELIKKVNSFWDVGANIGYYSILGCQLNPELTVVAFEPSKGPSYYLYENSRLNNFSDRIQIHEIALSDISTTIEFYQVYNLKFPTIRNLSGEHNIGTKKDLPSEKIEVRAKRLDEIREHTSPIDLIKIDVEGAEVQVLKGGLNTIKNDRPIIICEVLYNVNEAEIESTMKDLDYSFFAHVGNGLKRMESLIRNSDDGVRNVFLVPPEKVDLISEFIQS